MVEFSITVLLTLTTVSPLLLMMNPNGSSETLGVPDGVKLDTSVLLREILVVSVTLPLLQLHDHYIIYTNSIQK